MRIPTFPYVSIGEFDAALDFVKGAKLNVATRKRLNQTLQRAADRDGEKQQAGTINDQFVLYSPFF